MYRGVRTLVTICYVRLLIRGRFQNPKGGETAMSWQKGGVHGRHEEGLGCREVD